MSDVQADETRELVQANACLKAEIAERERVEVALRESIKERTVAEQMLHDNLGII